MVNQMPVWSITDQRCWDVRGHSAVMVGVAVVFPLSPLWEETGYTSRSQGHRFRHEHLGGPIPPILGLECRAMGSRR
jgi:hypothetical protein